MRQPSADQSAGGFFLITSETQLFLKRGLETIYLIIASILDGVARPSAAGMPQSSYREVFTAWLATPAGIQQLPQGTLRCS